MNTRRLELALCKTAHFKKKRFDVGIVHVGVARPWIYVCARLCQVENLNASVS